MSIKESSLAKLLKYVDTRESDPPGSGRSDTPTASGLPMPTDPKKRAKQVDRDTGSKYTPQLEDLPENIQNTLSKAVRRKKDQPAKDIPVSIQRKHLRRMKEYLEHFSAINSDTVLQATAFDDMAAKYERLYGMKNVGKIKYPSPLVPSNKLTLEHDSSKKLEGQHKHETHQFPADSNTYVSYNLPKDDKDGNPYHGSHTDGDHTFPVKIDHDKDMGSVEASFGGLKARLDLDSSNQTHHDTAKAEKYPEYAALKPTQVSINRDVTPANTQAHVEDLQRQRQTNPPIDYRMSLSKLLLQKINFGSISPGDNEPQKHPSGRERLGPEEKHIFWLPKKPENEDLPFPLAETTAHNHKANHIDFSQIDTPEKYQRHFAFDREFSPKMTLDDGEPMEQSEIDYGNHVNSEANEFLIDAHKYRDALEDPENAYKLTYADHIAGHQAIAHVNNFMTIPNYGGEEGRGLNSSQAKGSYDREVRMNSKSAEGREAEKRQSHPGLVNIQSPSLWDLLGFTTRHGHADPEWEAAVDRNRDDNTSGQLEERGFHKGEGLHRFESGLEGDKFILPDSRRYNSRTVQPRWDTAKPENCIAPLMRLMLDAASMEGAIGAEASLNTGQGLDRGDTSLAGLNVLEAMFPPPFLRGGEPVGGRLEDPKAWQRASIIYKDHEELLWEYGIYNLSEYINLSRALNLVTDLDSKAESVTSASYHKIFGRLGGSQREQADPSNPDNWNGGALADLGIQGAISPIIQQAVDNARESYLQHEKNSENYYPDTFTYHKDFSHTFSNRFQALSSFLNFMVPGFKYKPTGGEEANMMNYLREPLEKVAKGSLEEKPITPASFYKGTTDQGLNTGVQVEGAVDHHLSSDQAYISDEGHRRGITLQNPLKGRTLLMPFGTNNEALKTFDDMRKPIIQGAMNFVDQAYEQSPVDKVAESKEAFKERYYKSNIHDVRMAQYPFYSLDGSVGVTVGKGETDEIEGMDDKGYRRGNSRAQSHPYTFYHHPRADQWESDGGLLPHTPGEALPYHEALGREGIAKHHVFYPSHEDMYNHAYSHRDDWRRDPTSTRSRLNINPGDSGTVQYAPLGTINRVMPSWDQVQQETQEGKESRQYKPFEPPAYDDPWKIPPVQKLLLYIRKEGDGGGDGGDGGGFNGLSGTVFTSANSGIFTPTYGGSKAERRSRKNKKKQDRKRKKLLGKDKRNGVDKLVQFLYDGSPMQKAKKPNKDMTGDAATAHAWNNKKSGRVVLDWQKVANGNTPNSYMGNPGTLDNSSGAASYPQEEDNSNGITPIPHKKDWGGNKYYVQKAWYDSNEETSKEQALMGRVADTYRSTNIGQTFNEITDNEHHLDASLMPDLTDDENWLHDEYATTNNRLDQWANYASQNDNYQDNLRQVLGNVATDGKVTVYRGHHKDDDSHSSSKHKHVGVTTSPSTAMKFRGAAVPNRPDEMSSQVPMQDWHISSWNVPVDHITAHGDASEHELIMDKDKLNQHEVTTRPMTEFADNYTGSSAIQKSYEPLIKVASSAPQNWKMPNQSNPPGGSKSGNGTPQDPYVQEDNDYFPPGKDADIKENDMVRRTKSYDDNNEKEPFGGLQMMAFGSGPDSFSQDELGRGGEQDIRHDEEDIDEKERGNVWVPEDKDEVEKFKKLYKSLQDENDPTPLLTALHNVDYV